MFAVTEHGEGKKSVHLIIERIPSIETQVAIDIAVVICSVIYQKSISVWVNVTEGEVTMHPSFTLV